MNNSFKVYVSCMTYNQSAYIKDALDGFCMQQTSFPFVCGIIDDASTDGEQEMIQHYLEESFDLADSTIMKRDETDDYTRIFARHKENKNCYFAVVFLKYNHYSQRKNKIPYVKEWRNDANYVAFCEGDDYWIDSIKLQKQVDYLDNHPECAMSYTRTMMLQQKTGEIKKGPNVPYRGLKSLLMRNYISTLSVVISSKVLRQYFIEINPSQYKWAQGDYPIWLYSAANYTIHYLPDITSVYRMHLGSASRPLDIASKKSFLESHVDVQRLFAQKYNMPNEVINAIEYNAAYNLVLTYISFGQHKEAFVAMRHLRFKDKLKCIVHLLLKK